MPEYDHCIYTPTPWKAHILKRASQLEIRNQLRCARLITFFNSSNTTSFVFEAPTQPMASCFHCPGFSDSDPLPSSCKDPCDYIRSTRYSRTISPSQDPYSHLQSPLPCKLTRAHFLGIRTWRSLWGRYSVYHYTTLGSQDHPTLTHHTGYCC